SRGRARPRASRARATPRRWPPPRAATARPRRTAAGAEGREHGRPGRFARGRRLSLPGGAALYAQGQPGHRRAVETCRRAEFPHLRKTFWGRHIWARGYFCCSTGNVTDEVVAENIANQSRDQDKYIKVGG